MRYCTTCAQVHQWRASSPVTASQVGFVPTMGALHCGHQALIRRARSECDYVVASIFVNPLQFGPQEDYRRYPRKREQDLRICEQEQVDLVFAPSVQEMYPPGFSARVEMHSPLTRVLEESHRPGHFAGVTTVLTKLFNLTAPLRSYFGQKDYQQLLVVQALVRDLNLPTEVVMVPTVREPDGLAVSSRNRYLTPEERQAAPILYRSLDAGRRKILEGVGDPARVERHMQHLVREEPVARSQYLVVRDSLTLSSPSPRCPHLALLGAVRIGAVRLIDNLLVRAPEEGQR